MHVVFVISFRRGIYEVTSSMEEYLTVEIARLADSRRIHRDVEVKIAPIRTFCEATVRFCRFFICPAVRVKVGYMRCGEVAAVIVSHVRSRIEYAINANSCSTQGKRGLCPVMSLRLH
jgi:hypothetical protein